jgi:hypothetical protein
MSDNWVIGLEVPVAIAVCGIYVLSGQAIDDYKDKYGVSPWIHESAIAALSGVLVGGIIKATTGEAVTFDRNLFYFLILPPIIFCAGYSLKRKRFFKYIHYIGRPFDDFQFYLTLFSSLWHCWNFD